MNKPEVALSTPASLKQAYQVAMACQETGFPYSFYTTFYYKKSPFPYSLISRLSPLLPFKERQLLIGRRAPGLNDDHIKNLVHVEFLIKFYQFINKKGSAYYSFLMPLYDKHVSKYLTKCDIFYGYEDTALYSMQKAKKLEALTVLELRSLQPLYNQVIADETKRLRLKTDDDPNKNWNVIIKRKREEIATADYLVVYTDFFKRYLMKEHAVPKHRIRVLPLGIDLKDFCPRKDGTTREKETAFTILFVGGISPRKGVYYLLKAVKELKLKNIELQLIGTIALGMENILREHSGYFKYLGTVPYNKLVDYYNAADIFVLPSLSDSFGLVVYEAMACGLPVIITENCGAEIRDGIDGFVVPIRDVKALKDKILLLYENKKVREEMGRNAREYIKNFTWEKYRERLAGILIEIYEGNQPKCQQTHHKRITSTEFTQTI